MSNYDPRLDEAMLQHYDDLGDYGNYKLTIERMRRNGYEPKGPAAPKPNSDFYRAERR